MVVNAVVEIPQYSSFKFEVKTVWTPEIMNLASKQEQVLVLDRVLKQEVPYSYGFFPNTLVDDGDPLDVFIIANGYIPPLTQVKVQIIGGYHCIDNGQVDDKLLGQLVGDDTYPRTSMIEHYLKSYKPGFEVIRELTKEEAIKVYEDSLKSIGVKF